MTQTVPEAPILVAVGASTDAGRRREHNEDALLRAEPLFLVADGMGGYEAGELASAAALAAFAPIVGTSSVGIHEMREAYVRAGANVMAIATGGKGGAGTTLTGIAIAQNDGAGYWLVINVGDSRTYRFAGGRLEQVSVDHSLVQELIDSGELSAEQALSYSHRNVVTRALGAGAVSEPDFWMIPANQGDRMLMCSDGLTGELSDDAILALLAECADPQDAADRLVAAAVDHGGRDNVTAIVVDAVSVANSDLDSHGDTVPRPRENS